jgi:peptidoglycan/xylan/chitin deacetylase (PgdA/CDA1 family)
VSDNPTKLRIKHIAMKWFYHLGLYFLVDRFIGPKGLYIVGYHRLSENISDKSVHVLAVTQKNFEDHVRYYKKNFEIISLHEVNDVLQQSKLKKNYLVITFDDGYRDNYTLGKDIFKKFKISPTIFLTANHIEQRRPFWTDVVESIVHKSEVTMLELDILNIKGRFNLSTYEEKVKLAELIKNEIKKYDEETKHRTIAQLANTCNVSPSLDDSLVMDWQEANELSKLGVTMGSHTMNHPTLSKIIIKHADCELRESKHLIEQRLQRNVDHFAYPYGKHSDYTEAVKKEVSTHYKSAVTAINGINHPGQDPHELKRVMVENIDVYQLRIRLLKTRIVSLINK